METDGLRLVAPFLEDQSFGNNVTKSTFCPMYPSVPAPDLCSKFLSPLAPSPVLYCRGHSARLCLLLLELGACWASQWLPWDCWTPTVGSISSYFLIQNNPSQLFAGPGHLLAPQVLWSALQCAVRPFKGMFWSKLCFVFAKFIFSKEWKGIIIVPRPLLGKGKKRKVAQWGSINTVLAVRQWSTGGKSPFFSLPSPVI